MAVGKKVGTGAFLKSSPTRFIGSIIGGAAAIIGGVDWGGKRAAAEKKAQEDLDRRKREFEELDTSNIYENVRNVYEGISMENVYEDLTVNQQQAQFQAQQQAQQRADVMQNLRGAAGGSGIAALAQTMAGQQALGTQQIAATLGQQEARNQALMAKGAQDVLRREQLVAAGAGEAQQMRLQGAEAARGLEFEKTQGLMSMAAGQLGQAKQAQQQAQQQMIGGIGQVASGIAGGVGQKMQMNKFEDALEKWGDS